ncbi:MAG: hypothetical protein ACOX68_09080 [Candidatus Limivicinus sp.]
MDYPLIISGSTCGELKVRKEGLFTVFEASAPYRDELLRISVYGDGREACLGLMEPRGNKLYIRRKLSRLDMQDFPRNIEYAAPRGLLPECSAADDEAGDDALSRETDINIIPAAADEPEEEPEAKSDGVTSDDSGSEQLWFSQGDGTLFGTADGQRYIALPAQLRKNTAGPRLKNICGRIYMLFKY